MEEQRRPNVSETKQNVISHILNGRGFKFRRHTCCKNSLSGNTVSSQGG